MIGSGYPRRLTREKLSIPARIMAIADVFEALTASDRPYKEGKTLSEAIHIMRAMKEEGYLDAELFGLFLHAGIPEAYAAQYLKAGQADEVDPEVQAG
jgi:HD-GYP domain-containing protein (c-di-GMP phosphodiesterase class II)